MNTKIICSGFEDATNLSQFLDWKNSNDINVYAGIDDNNVVMIFDNNNDALTFILKFGQAMKRYSVC